MTTIAYRDGVMAGDGRETLHGEQQSPMVIREDVVKVFKLKDGVILGVCGTSEHAEQLRRSLSRKRSATPELDDCQAIMVGPDRVIYVYEGAVWVRQNAAYYAIGTGALMAFAAMDADATARKAVEIGIKRDPFSGGNITEVELARVEVVGS